MTGQLTHEDHVANLLHWYGLADEDCRSMGRTWYADQREATRLIARTYDVSYMQAAAVVAALSPQTRWAQNLAGASRLIRAYNAVEEMPGNVTLYRKNAIKAWKILQGESPLEIFATSPKVSRFFLNLVGNENVVTVDTWMAKAVGEEKGTRNGIKAALYNRISAAVKDAAFQMGEVPAQFQAIVWCAVRGKGE